MSRRGTDPIKLFLYVGVMVLLAFMAFAVLPAWVWIGMLALVGLVAYVSHVLEVKRISKLPPCSSCGKKGTFIFMHTRVDGGPDRRHKYNPIVCGACRAVQH